MAVDVDDGAERKFLFANCKDGFNVNPRRSGKANNEVQKD